MKTYFVALMQPGSRWIAETGAREQPFWKEHAAYADALFDAGKIFLGGPFADGSGTMVVYRVSSRQEVFELYELDPWVIHDVLVIGEVKEWTIFLDSRERD